MNTISNLPMHLVEEILTRIPLKSLRKVQLTCRNWNTLSKSESFMNVHVGKARARAREEEDQSQMIVLIDYNLSSVSITFNDDHPSTDPKGELTCLNKEIKISNVYHSEGLLLCILKDDTRFLVWNPYCKQTRWIEPRYSHLTNGRDRFSHALGYEDKKSGPGVKLLRFIDYFYKEPEKQFFCYEIYDFDSDLWTTLDVTPYWWIMYSCRGVSLKGNTYWCAGARNSREDRLVDHIICFDFTKERFGPLLPLPFSAGPNDYATLSCVRDDKLAVLLQHNEINFYELEIWITTKIDVENVLWSKFLVMETVHPVIVPWISNCFFVDKEKKLAMGFDADDPSPFCIIGQDGYSIKLNLGGPKNKNCRPYGCSYVPSLVQIKKHAQVKRKGDNSLEKDRFDRMMSRLAAFEKQKTDDENARLAALKSLYNT